METQLAIMMADLSGYTALTEIHGGATAAAMVERYLEIISQSLVGDSRLHERAGDQVIIVSPSAEHLAWTASMLFEKAHEEDNFLPIHAGLHYGLLLHKDNAYYGSALNTTARIMAAAGRGAILCSEEFKLQLPGTNDFVLRSLGEQRFKNLLKPVSLYQLHCCHTHIARTYVIDPVCHMLITSPASAISLEHKGERIYFCSESCLLLFKQMNDGDK